MVLLDEVLERSLARSGLTLVPLDIFLYNSTRLQSIFVNSVHEYSQFRPRRIEEVLDIGSSPYKLPEGTIDVIAVSPSLGGDSYFAVDYSRLPNKEWKRDRDNLHVWMLGPYRVIRLAEYTVDFQELSYDAITISPSMTQVRFRLRGDYQPGSLKLTLDTRESTDNGARVLAGTLGSGLVSADSREVVLNLTAGFTPGKLKVEFTSLYYGVKELDMRHTLFADLFMADLLVGYGQSKEMLVMDGLPVNLNLQILMDQGREMRLKVDEELRTDSDWWHFDY